MDKRTSEFVLCGAASTHIEFKFGSGKRLPLRYPDMFEFSCIETWNDLLEFAEKKGALYCRLAMIPTYLDILFREASVPSFKGNWGNALSYRDIPDALPWEEEKNVFIKEARRSTDQKYPDVVELTSVWWDTVHLFRRLLMLYGVSGGWIKPNTIADAFTFQIVDGRKYFLSAFPDSSLLMQEMKIIPHWWLEQVSDEAMLESVYPSMWFVEVNMNDSNKEQLIQRYAKSILFEVVNEFFASIPLTHRLDEDGTLRLVYPQNEDNALVSSLFYILAEFIQDRREVGLCPECGNPIDKSQSRGTARMYCSKPSCKVKASQKRKRFVRECKASGRSIEYAVVQLGEAYQPSIERWWLE